jgi:hypothetical protein
VSSTINPPNRVVNNFFVKVGLGRYGSKKAKAKVKTEGVPLVFTFAFAFLLLTSRRA